MLLRAGKWPFKCFYFSHYVFPHHAHLQMQVIKQTTDVILEFV